MEFEARLKPEHRRDHPDMSGFKWYPVVPLWPASRRGPGTCRGNGWPG